LPSMDAQQVATEIVEEWLVGLSPIERDDAVQGVSS